MNSTKCAQCGLVYWSTAPNCKRCGLPTPGALDGASDAASNQASHESSYAETYAETPQYTAMSPMEVMNFHDDPVREKLLKNLRRDAQFFYFVGGLQCFVWFFMGRLLIVDGLLNIGLSFIAHKYKSRAAAILLMLLMVLGVLIGALALALTGMSKTPLLPIVLLVRLATSIRMVYSTFKLKGYSEAEVVRVLPPPPPSFHPESAPYPESAPQWAPPAQSAQWQPSAE